MKEVLKDVVGYEGLYSVSSKGYILSLITGNKMTGTGKKGKDSWYLRVNLSRNNKVKTKYIHRLVAEAFIPNPNNKPCVNHKNGIKTDNVVENLEWCTHKENTVHGWENGLMENTRDNLKRNALKRNALRGEKNPLSKLTEKQVLKIRKEYGPGNSMYKLAKKYGVSKTKIRQIIIRQCWRHI